MGGVLSYLDALLDRDSKIILRIFDCADLPSLSLKANQDSCHIIGLRRRVRKTCRAVPAMRCSQDLYVVLMSGFQNHLPEVVLHRMVNAVFRFVNDQESIAAIGKSQSDAEQARSPVAQAFQRNRLILPLDLYDRPSAISTASSSVIADYCNAVHLVAKDQIQRLDRPGFIIRKRYLIPEPRHVHIAQYTRSQRLASDSGGSRDSPSHNR